MEDSGSDTIQKEDISGLDKEEIIRRGEDYEREIKKQNDAGMGCLYPNYFSLTLKIFPLLVLGTRHLIWVGGGRVENVKTSGNFRRPPSLKSNIFVHLPPHVKKILRLPCSIISHFSKKEYCFYFWRPSFG